MTEQRLPIVNSDDGVWGDILRQYLMKEHYNDDTDNAANGGHKTITIQAGTASAGTAPLKFTSGTLLSSPEAGAIEFNTDTLYFTQTTSTTRKKIAAYNDASGAEGDIYYRDSSGYFTRLAIGSTDEVLTVVGGLPSWEPAAATGGSGGMLEPVQAHTDGSETYTISGGSVTQISGTTIQNGTYAPAVGDRIMIWTAPASTGAGTQFTTTTQPANGIYTVTSNTTNLSLSRATDLSGSVHPAGLRVYSQSTSVGWYSQAIFTITTPTGPGSFTYGTNNIGWTTPGLKTNNLLISDTTNSILVWNGTGSTTIQPTGSAGNHTLTLPSGTDTIVARNSTDTLTNKTLTAPRFADMGHIADSNGNEMLIFDSIGSAVNEITIGNQVTGTGPYIQSTGADTNIDLNIYSKGTGNVNIFNSNGGFIFQVDNTTSNASTNYAYASNAPTGSPAVIGSWGGDANVDLDIIPRGSGKINFKATSSGPAEIRLFEDSDNGTNYVGVIAPSALSSNVTLTLPSASGTLATLDDAGGKFTTTIGDGSSTSIAVTHNLGTRSVVVSVHDASTFEEIDCDVVKTSTTQVTLTFATAPATNAYVATIVGGAVGADPVNAKGPYASLPAAGTTGRYYAATDTDLLLYDNGTSWDIVGGGSRGPAFTAPPTSSWSTTTLGSSTVAANLDGRLFTIPDGSGTNARVEYRTLSPTSNYSFTVYIEPTIYPSSYTLMGIYLRQSSDGKLVFFGPTWDSTGNIQLEVWQMSSPTVYGSQYGASWDIWSDIGQLPNWYRFRDNGTTRFAEYSLNGLEWITVHSVGRTDFLTPNQIGWGGDVDNAGFNSYLRLRSWSVT